MEKWQGYFSLSILCLIMPQNFKKIFREWITRQCCIILAQIWPKLPLPRKGIYLVNSLLLWCNFTPSHHISNFLESESWDILGHKVVWFWPKFCWNCTIVLNKDFWGKLTNTNFFNLLCPIMQKYFKVNWDINWNRFLLSSWAIFCAFMPP